MWCAEDKMNQNPYVLFNKSPEQLRRLGARGGRTSAYNRRARLARLAQSPHALPARVPEGQTVADAIQVLDVQFPWLRGSEKRVSPNRGGLLQPGELVTPLHAIGSDAARCKCLACGGHKSDEWDGDRKRSHTAQRRMQSKMKIFTIDAENHITAFASRKQVPAKDGNIALFSGAEELAEVADAWRAARFIDIWNSLPGVKPVRKFTDRQTAARRIFAAIQGLEAAPEAAAGKVRESAGQPRPEARVGSKKAQVLALLRTSEGASVRELMAAMTWQRHTVRGFVSGTLVRKMGLAVESYRRESGERAYRIG